MLLTTMLHLLQPAARLYGRASSGLTPWRRRGIGRATTWPWPRLIRAWTLTWSPHERRLHDLEASLRRRGAVVVSGGDFDRWDCEVRGGALGSTRVRLLVEEHGQGRQLARFRVWPHASGRGLALVGTLAAAAVAALVDHAPAVAAVFGGMALFGAARMTYECAASMATTIESLLSRMSAATETAETTASPILDDPDVEDLGLAGGPQP
jgi:hypothetical protein